MYLIDTFMKLAITSELMSDSLQNSQGNLHHRRKDDAYENNNTFKTAYNLTHKENTDLSDIKGLGKALDDDFYKIRVTPGALRVVVDLAFDHEQGNLDLFLFDERGNLVSSSASTTDNERIDVTVDQAGIYFVKVIPVDDLAKGNTYDLRWDDLVPETAFRTLDGHANNLSNPNWGATESQLLRLTDPAYEDDISDPRGGLNSTLSSAREISNAVAAQDHSLVNSRHLSDLFWQWGQFVDHDLDLTESAHPLEAFNIKVPTGDPYFDPFGSGTKTINLSRSIYNQTTGTDANTPRQQINEITAYLDGSMVYGSNEATATALRTHDGTGKLLTTIGKNGEVLLPFASDGTSFLAGDIRVNEQLGLISMHTLFVREHNRLAEKIGMILNQDSTILNINNPQKVLQFYQESGLEKADFIYESARRIVGAEIQKITYQEFLPLLIGKQAIDRYTGYDETVNSGISNEFSTAAFRVGHTMLSPQLLRIEADGAVEEIALRNAFFNPGEVVNDGVDTLLRGLGSQAAQEIDNFIIDDVRNFLFGPPGAGGFDLVSLNIQRGRDHGLADINTVRTQLGLSAYHNFDELTGGNAILAEQFASVYDSVDEVDLWIGGLAEKHATRAVVGSTFQAIIADQFTRLRDGDRFFYQNDPYLKVFHGVVDQSVTLADIIKANSTVTDIQSNAFLVADVTNVATI